jgi:hypothetical protein
LYLKFYEPLDTIKFACNSVGIEELPDDAHALKRVGAVEWSNKLSKVAFKFKDGHPIVCVR